MTAREVIWVCLQQSGMTQTELAARVGMKQGNLSRMLSIRSDGSDTKIGTLIKLLDAMDAQLVVQTCGGGEDEFILDGEDEGIIEDARDAGEAFPDY